MKRRTLPTIFWLSLLWWGLQTSVAQTLEGVIAKHVEATGGAERWRNIQSMQMTSEKKSTGGQISLSDASFKQIEVVTALHGLGSRMDLYAEKQEANSDSASVERMMSMVVSPYTGGWIMQPGEEVRAMPEEPYQFALLEIDLQPLLMDYAQKARTFTLKKKQKKVGGERCYVIEGQLTAGITLDLSLYISTESHRMLKLSYSQADSDSGVTAYIEETYSDFREVEGYVFSFKTSRETIYGGQAVYVEETQVTELLVNVPVDEAVFEPDEE